MRRVVLLLRVLRLFTGRALLARKDATRSREAVVLKEEEGKDREV